MKSGHPLRFKLLNITRDEHNMKPYTERLKKLITKVIPSVM